MMTIDFGADGIATCLHSDDIPLQSIGTLTVRRASEVEFNEATQLWEVVTQPEKGFRHIHYVSHCRADCLQWERENWERFL